jgi:hypothetical protein
MSSISQEMRRDAQKSPADLEHEIDATRAELEDTLEELEHRLNPNELFNQAMTRVRQHGGEFTQNLGESIKQNPLPTLLTSIGIAWLMATNARSDGDMTSSDLRRGMHDTTGRLRRGLHDTRDALRRGKDRMAAAKDRMSAAKDRATGALHEGEESIREGIESSRSAISRSTAALRSGTQNAADSARYLRSQARQRAYRAKAGAQHMLAEQPLLLGALGIAAGALLGAALPSSEQEDRSFGRLRDDTLDKAKSLGAQGMRRAREKAEEIADQSREALTGNGNGHARSNGSTDSGRSERVYSGSERSGGMSTSSGGGLSASERGTPSPSPSTSRTGTSSSGSSSSAADGKSSSGGSTTSSGLSASSSSGSLSSEWPNPSSSERNEDLRVNTPKTPKS